MAVTRDDLLEALRLPDNPDDVQKALIDRLSTVSSAIVANYAASAPTAIADEATIRLVGWLYDSPPEEGRAVNPLRASGAQALLSPYRSISSGLS